MRFYLIATAVSSAVATEKFYNVLTLDGGGIKGIIPGVALTNLEKHAYEYI